MGDSETVIRVENLSKKYVIRHKATGRSDTLRDLLTAAPQRLAKSLFGSRSAAIEDGTREEFWALKDVSFEVKRGEVVGIIGRNGAGKSTLLKVLSRITEPTSGRIALTGRVASLLEVGTGFHPELSGRENIFLNGAILGMTRSEVRRKFDEIVAFAEVEKFLDTPVKRYSSGMYVRLAFAVAAHLEPEILIVDEVLAVGDTEFQKKCLGRMKSVANEGRTVLFVSHNMSAVQSLCTRACYMAAGCLVFDGVTDDTLTVYSSSGNQQVGSRWRRTSESHVGPLSFTEASVWLEGEQPNLKLMMDLRLKGDTPHSPAFIAVDIADGVGVVIMQALPLLGDMLMQDQDEHFLKMEVELPPLVPGLYTVTYWVGPHNTETYDLAESVVQFEVSTSPILGRSFPHTRDHGWIVPLSSLERVFS